MVANARPFPDIQAGVIEWAQGLYPEALVTDDLPTKYGDVIPVVTIEDESGMSDGLTLFTSLRIRVYARDRGHLSGRQIARDIASDLCGRMTVYPRHFGGVVVDTAEIVGWPARSKAQEPDERTVCFSGEVNVSLRR